MSDCDWEQLRGVALEVNQLHHLGLRYEQLHNNKLIFTHVNIQHER